MTSKPDPAVAQMSGIEALPRKNGELTFDALWEGRVFGMAVALNEQGTYPWQDFRDELVARIASADAAGETSGYYERFLGAFEKLALKQGLVTLAELEMRTAEYTSGERDDFDEEEHDHDHDHHGH